MRFSAFKTSYSREPFTDLQLSDFASIVHDPGQGGSVFVEGARIVNKIREARDAKIQKQLKQQLPAISPGALFGHNRQDLSQFTGLMQIDIDEGISDPEQLRNELGQLSWVMFSSLSVRQGVYFLVQIPEPDRQPDYWDKINAWLMGKYNIYADSARKNPKDLRFYAPDKDAIYNPNATVLKKLAPPMPSMDRATFFKTQQTKSTNGYVSPLDDFNHSADVLSMLISDGWKISHRSGKNVRLTRPGKSHGTSADWNEDLRRLYVFSNNCNLVLDDCRHALSAVDIFMKMQNINTLHEVRRQLSELGYGKF